MSRASDRDSPPLPYPRHVWRNLLQRSGLRLSDLQGADEELDSMADSISVPVRNETGSTLAAHTLVYVSGANSDGDTLVAATDANDAAKMPALGFVQEELETAQNGRVVLLGHIRDVALPDATYDVGDELYVSGTVGEFTKTAPTGATDVQQRVAIVTKVDDTEGEAFVTGPSIDNNVSGTLVGLGLTAAAGKLLANPTSGAAALQEVGLESPLTYNSSTKAIHIATGDIVSAQIADGAVIATLLGSGAVETDKVNNGAITTDKLAADCVTSAKIADDAVGSEHLADDAVGSAAIADGSVDTARLGADAVTGAKLADDAVGSEHIADDAVVAAAIADDAVGSAAIADDAVGSAQIADGAVDTARLGADAVTGAKIADDAIGSEHIADDAVGSAAIADGAVDTARLSDGAVTEAKLANTHVLRADRQVGNPYATLSTTTITQWYSLTIPGGTLATRNVRVVAHGTLKQNSGSAQNFRAVVRLGGTDIHEAAGSISDDADDAIWRMELELSYRANRNQFVSGTWRVSGQYNSSDGISNIFGITKDGIWGNDAIGQNDTGDLALSFHQKWDTSTTSSDFKVYSVAVEYV